MSLKTQFAVEMTCEGCAKSVRGALEKVEGVESVVTDVANKEVHVVSVGIPPERLLQIIRDTGKEAYIHGLGAVGDKGDVVDQGLNKGDELGTAVCVLEYPAPKGVIRFVQLTQDRCTINITLHGLTPGRHGVHVHEYGDISEWDKSVGRHWNPAGNHIPFSALRSSNMLHEGKRHGDIADKEKHAGDLGNVLIDSEGKGELIIESDALKVWDIIGMSVVVKEGEDDLGRAENEQSGIDGNSGKGVVFGIVARSAGFGENRKKVCLCDSKEF